MSENKKGANTLYAVIGIATLVVAIIGATFAFFSATETNSDITGTIAEAGGLSIVASQITDNTNSNIIPLNLIVDQTLKEGSETDYVDHVSQFASAMTNKCKDSNGNNVCAVYKVVVSNLSKTSTIQVRGKLKLTSSTANMYWTLINATETTEQIEVPNSDLETGTTQQNVQRLDTATDIEGFTKVKQGFDGNMTYSSTTGNIGTEELQFTANLAESLSLYGTDSDEGESSKTFYVLVWLEEIGTAQQTEDASQPESVKSYTGNITFDAVDANGNKSGVTATFNS